MFANDAPSEDVDDGSRCVDDALPSATITDDDCSVSSKPARALATVIFSRIDREEKDSTKTLRSASESDRG